MPGSCPGRTEGPKSPVIDRGEERRELECSGGMSTGFSTISSGRPEDPAPSNRVVVVVGGDMLSSLEAGATKLLSTRGWATGMTSSDCWVKA